MNPRSIRGVRIQMILTLIASPLPTDASPEQQKTCCRERNAEHNQKELHRQAQEYQQHTRKYKQYTY